MQKTTTRWLAEILTREGEDFGTSAELGDDGRLRLRWDGD